MLRATEMDYWERAVGIPKMERVANGRIREILKINTRSLKTYLSILGTYKDRILRVPRKYKCDNQNGNVVDQDHG